MSKTENLICGACGCVIDQKAGEHTIDKMHNPFTNKIIYAHVCKTCAPEIQIQYVVEESDPTQITIRYVKKA